jgi:hypothetical protein
MLSTDALLTRLAEWGFAEEISHKERRKLALERTFFRYVPHDVKNIDYVKFIREDRDR